MTQEEQAGIIGLSLIDNQLRIVEGVKQLPNEFEVTQLAQGRVRQPFNFDVFADKNMPRRFAEDISRLYETQDFKVKDVAFSLDSRMVFVKKISVDAQLEPDLLKDQIKWEVGQFTVSPVKDYIVDFENLNSNTNGSLSSMLVVVVRKKIVKFLKELFKHTDLRLKVIDVDVFSAQRALQLNYEYNIEDKICLLSIEENKIYLSILKGKSFFLTYDVPLQDEKGVELSIESTARLISKELRRIILDNQLGKGVEDLSDIFLYGDAVEDGLLEELQNSYDVHIDKANPFRKIKLPARIKEDEAVQSRFERYMVPIGAALRGIE